MFNRRIVFLFFSRDFGEKNAETLKMPLTNARARDILMKNKSLSRYRDVGKVDIIDARRGLFCRGSSCILSCR